MNPSRLKVLSEIKPPLILVEDEQKIQFDWGKSSLEAVVSGGAGGAGGALATLEFGSSVNPIPTRRGRLCPPHYC